MGTAFGDLDGDGLPDLFVTNFYGESTTFFKNLGRGIFADQTSAIGLAGPSRYLLGFGIVLFDANNDGRLDLARRTAMSTTIGPISPRDAGTALDRRGSGTPGRRHPASRASLDRPADRPRARRGRSRQRRPRSTWCRPAEQPARLLPQPDRETGGHAVAFLLEGTRSNRDGVGAVVTVTAGGRRRRAWRYGGGSYQSASDPRIHFGLGADRIEQVEVRWPSGQVDRFTDLEADRCYRLREGDKAPASSRSFPALGVDR